MRRRMWLCTDRVRPAILVSLMPFPLFPLFHPSLTITNTGTYGTGLPPSTSNGKLLNNNYDGGAAFRKGHVDRVIAIPLKNLQGVKQVGTQHDRDVLLFPNRSIDLAKVCEDGKCKLIKR